MSGRVTYNWMCQFNRVILICALVGLFLGGDRFAPSRVLVDQLLAQAPPGTASEEETEDEEVSESKTARTESSPRRQLAPLHAFSVSFPCAVNPPGTSTAQATPLSRLPADRHSLVSPLRC